jgi:hypothetical protein
MRLNGTVNIERDDNANYVLGYAPLNALLRNGTYGLDGVWLSEAEMQEHDLGRALCLEAPGGLAYAYARV